MSTYVALEQEDWFEDEIRFVRRFLRPGMRGIDVGANFGFYTLAMGAAVGAGGKVWAFEPSAATARFLGQSVALNGLGAVAEVHELAVSDQEGMVGFDDHEEAEMRSVSAGGAQRVRATTLDRFCADAGAGQVDFIKLDVEGHELQALRGARRILAESSPLVMLEIKSRYEHALEAPGFLKESGYELYRLLPGALFLVPMETDRAPDRYQLNVLACKPDRAEQLASAGLLAKGRDPRVEDEAASLAPDVVREFKRFLDEGRSPDERWAWLLEALGTSTGALLEADRLEALCSHARLSWEAGLRDDAVGALLRAAQRGEAERRAASGLPHVSPSPRLDSSMEGGCTEPELRCAVAEQLARWHTFSSCITSADSLAFLDPVRALPERSRETDRRLQLIRMYQQKALAPEPWPRLIERAEDNLNPGFWRGETIG